VFGLIKGSDTCKVKENLSFMEKTFAEFFAGIGLMRMGLEQGGWKILFANDIDEQKKEMYFTNFPDSGNHFLIGDIHKIPSPKIPTVALATASFPCNDLSLAGAREGLDGDNSSAFWGFIKIIRNMKERRPPLMLIENVTGFLTSNEGRDFEDAMLALNDLGYVVDPFILDASRFVPQSRQRLFVVCLKRNPTAPEEIHEHFFQSSTRPQALAEFIFSHPDINWRIRKLPEPPVRRKSLENILEDLPEDSEEWWSADRAVYLLNQMSLKHRAIADRMIAGNDWSYGTVFRRVRNDRSMAELRTDGIAGCLRTPRGGSGRQILFKAGKGEYHVRLVTPRECARLMGADNFKIKAETNQALFGFGDAVCVPAIRWIAENYLNPVWNELYATENTEPKITKAVSYRKTVRA
jgi:DNA (cytosine-5)-methyltransferase 1